MDAAVKEGEDHLIAYTLSALKTKRRFFTGRRIFNRRDHKFNIHEAVRKGIREPKYFIGFLYSSEGQWNKTYA
ncbi:hypothetical protein GM31_22925 [Trabulsiella odontotermitis]|uniref:Uncharacterized protein n=1 Tax=Trabulsiella odontotermitis TaxID=379893 RepID=A0A0L0GUM7_9ENTR|nr:hypothetical protein GM31_22925 [Trabulsiella odontotermitis]